MDLKDYCTKKGNLMVILCFKYIFGLSGRWYRPGDFILGFGVYRYIHILYG